MNTEQLKQWLREQIETCNIQKSYLGEHDYLAKGQWQVKISIYENVLSKLSQRQIEVNTFAEEIGKMSDSEFESQMNQRTFGKAIEKEKPIVLGGTPQSRRMKTQFDEPKEQTEVSEEKNLISFASYLTGYSEETIRQMYNDYLNQKHK